MAKPGIRKLHINVDITYSEIKKSGINTTQPLIFVFILFFHFLLMIFPVVFFSSPFLTLVNKKLILSVFSVWIIQKLHVPNTDWRPLWAVDGDRIIQKFHVPNSLKTPLCSGWVQNKSHPSHKPGRTVERLVSKIYSHTRSYLGSVNLYALILLNKSRSAITLNQT